MVKGGEAQMRQRVPGAVGVQDLWYPGWEGRMARGGQLVRFMKR